MTTEPKPAVLPFFCPDPPAIHQDVDHVVRHTRRWCESTGLDTAAGRYSAEFMCRVAPHGHRDSLALCTAWIAWGFLFDDARCDRGSLATDPAAFAPLAGRVQRALEIGHPNARFDDGYVAAIHDLGGQLRRHPTPVLFQRLVTEHLTFLTGTTWQIANQARGHMPNLSDYVAMRTLAAGGGPTLALIQIANHADVPTDLYDAPAVRALTQMTQLVAALDNDRHSVARELEPGAADQNLLTVLASQLHCSLDDALYEAVRLRDRIMLRLLALREQILVVAPQGLRDYLLGLTRVIRGNNDWGVRTTRYHYAPADLCWSDQPLDPDPTPPGIPTIDGWWNPDLATLS